MEGAEERDPFDTSADRRIDEEEDAFDNEKFEDILYLRAYTGQIDQELREQEAAEQRQLQQKSTAKPDKPISKVNVKKNIQRDSDDSDGEEPMDQLKMGNFRSATTKRRKLNVDNDDGDGVVFVVGSSSESSDEGESAPKNKATAVDESTDDIVVNAMAPITPGLSAASPQAQKNMFSSKRYWLTSAPSSIRCYRCGLTGHVSWECTETNTRPCHLCGETDHEDRRCPNQLCYNCHKPGHESRNCKERRVSKEPCYRCERSGHRPWDCPLARRDADKYYVCYNCGSSDHSGYDCSAPRVDALTDAYKRNKNEFSRLVKESRRRSTGGREFPDRVPREHRTHRPVPEAYSSGSSEADDFDEEADDLADDGYLSDSIFAAEDDHKNRRHGGRYNGSGGGGGRSHSRSNDNRRTSYDGGYGKRRSDGHHRYNDNTGQYRHRGNDSHHDDRRHGNDNRNYKRKNR